MHITTNSKVFSVPSTDAADRLPVASSVAPAAFESEPSPTLEGPTQSSGVNRFEALPLGAASASVALPLVAQPVAPPVLTLIQGGAAIESSPLAVAANDNLLTVFAKGFTLSLSEGLAALTIGAVVGWIVDGIVNTPEGGYPMPPEILNDIPARDFYPNTADVGEVREEGYPVSEIGPTLDEMDGSPAPKADIDIATRIMQWQDEIRRREGNGDSVDYLKNALAQFMLSAAATALSGVSKYLDRYKAMNSTGGGGAATTAAERYQNRIDGVDFDLFPGLRPNELGDPRRAKIRIDGTNWSLAAQTYEGIGYKPRNEDGFVHGTYMNPAGVELPFGIVFDGIGGHGGGAEATTVAGLAMHESLSEGEGLRKSFEAGQSEIQGIWGTALQTPDTVMAAFRVFDEDGQPHLELAHVGDCGYIVFVRGADGVDRIVTRSIDETYPQMRDEELRQNGFQVARRPTLEFWLDPQNHEVVTSVAKTPPHLVKVKNILLQPGIEYRVVFSSDGISENTLTADFESLSQASPTAEAYVENLAQKTLDRMALLDRMQQQFQAVEDAIDALVATMKPHAKRYEKLRDLPGIPLAVHGYQVNSAGDLLNSGGARTALYLGIPERPGFRMNDDGVVKAVNGTTVDKYKADNIGVMAIDIIVP